MAPESGSLSQRPPFTLLWKEVYQLSTPRLAPSVGGFEGCCLQHSLIQRAFNSHCFLEPSINK